MRQVFARNYPTMRHAPHVRGWWSPNRISLIFLLALIPPLGVALVENTSTLFTMLGLTGLLSLGWNVVFARLRRQLPTLDWVVSAVSFSLMVPLALPLWQVALGFSFGVVIGEQIFGGRGLNFLSPVIVALAFLAFSFPGTEHLPRGDLFALAVVPGAILLLATGLISWRVLVGALVGLAGVLALVGTSDPLASVLLAPLAFGLVFFACDPVGAASTNPGRWIYGLLVGGLIGLFGLSGEIFGSPRAIIFAILLASVFAPLIDYLVIALNAIRRRRRHG